MPAYYLAHASDVERFSSTMPVWKQENVWNQVLLETLSTVDRAYNSGHIYTTTLLVLGIYTSGNKNTSLYFMYYVQNDTLTVVQNYTLTIEEGLVTISITEHFGQFPVHWYKDCGHAGSTSREP